MQKLFSILGVVALSISFFLSPAHAEQDCNWDGNWASNQGSMSLQGSNRNYTGSVEKLGSITAVSRKTNRNRCELIGTFSGTDTQNKGHFLIRKNGENFSGKWGNTSDQLIRSWSGEQITEQTNVVGSVQTNEMGHMKIDPSQKPLHVRQSTGTPQPVTMPSISDPNKISKPSSVETQPKTRKKWTLDLGKICLESSDDGPSYKEELYGMAWAKFRIVNKFTGNQEVIEPAGGFANTSGYQERFWEVYPNSGKLDLHEGFCNFSIFSLAFISYEIDARDYGYSDIAELERDPRNRLEVTVKLKEYDSISRDDDLGTHKFTHQLSDSDFDGLCYGKRGGYDNECMIRQRSQPGVMTGFRDGGTVARAILKLESE